MNVLPVEIILMIINLYGLRLGDLVSLSLTSRDLHIVVSDELYKRAARTRCKSVLFWAAQYNRPATLRRALDAGIHPDWRWRDEWFSLRHKSTNRLYPPGDCEDLESLSAHEELGNMMANIEDRSGFYTLQPRIRQPPTSQPPRNPRSWTALHIAALRGHSEILQILLERGADVDHHSQAPCLCQFRPCRHDANYARALRSPLSNQLRKTPLYRAIYGGSQSAFEMLLAHGASICFIADHGTSCNGEFYSEPVLFGPKACATAFNIACIRGRISMAQYLIDKNFVRDLNRHGHGGCPPLTCAYAYSQWPCFHWLMSKGARIPPYILTHAVTNGRFEDAARLIDLGIDPDVDMGGLSKEVLPLVCSYPRDVAWTPYFPPGWNPRFALLDRLLPLASSLDPDNYPATTAKCLLAACGNESTSVALVERLLAEGAGICYKNKAGISALGEACRLDCWNDEKLPIIKQLLRCGARAEIEQGSLEPITFAIESEDLVVCQYLFSTLSETFTKSQVEKLWKVVIYRGQMELARLLIEFDKADYIAQDRTSSVALVLSTLAQRTPGLHIRAGGAEMGLAVIRDLLDRGAPSPKNREFRALTNPLSAALWLNCDAALLRKMINNGTDLEGGAKKKVWADPLCIAAAKTADEGQYDLVRVLLDAGAQVYKRFRGRVRSRYRWEPGDDDISLPCNALVLAVANQLGWRDTVRLMLELQPLRYQDPECCTMTVLYAVFRSGANYALRLMLSCSDPDPAPLESLLRIFANQFLHTAIDTIWTNFSFPAVRTLESVHGTLDNIADLVHDFGADVESVFIRDDGDGYSNNGYYYKAVDDNVVGIVCYRDGDRDNNGRRRKVPLDNKVTMDIVRVGDCRNFHGRKAVEKVMNIVREYAVPLSSDRSREIPIAEAIRESFPRRIRFVTNEKTKRMTFRVLPRYETHTTRTGNVFCK